MLSSSSVICQTTDPNPLAKRYLHIVRSTASSFNSQYPLLSLDALISQIYFWNKNLHVSDSSSVHHHEVFIVHAAMMYVIQVLLTAREQDQDGTS